MGRTVRMYPPDYGNADAYGHVTHQDAHGDGDGRTRARISCVQRAATAMIQLTDYAHPRGDDAWQRDSTYINSAGGAIHGNGNAGHAYMDNTRHITCIISTLTAKTNGDLNTPSLVKVTLRSAALAYVGWRHYYLDDKKPYANVKQGLMARAHDCVGGDLESQDFVLKRCVWLWCGYVCVCMCDCDCDLCVCVCV
jgi:hypothetical protein